jgi:hypothetical protein
MPPIVEHRDNPRAVTYDANSAEHDRSDNKATTKEIAEDVRTTAANILVSNS